MNLNTKDKLDIILSEADGVYLGELESLELCKALIRRNPRLLKDYPKLEDAVTAINQVILSELD